MQLLARLSLRGFLEEPMETVGDRIRQQVAHILAAYRRHCNPGLNKGQVPHGHISVVVVVVVYMLVSLADTTR